MNNCIDSENRNYNRIYIEDSLTRTAECGDRIRQNARAAVCETAENAAGLYERIIAFLCGVIAFFELPVVVASCRLAAALASLALVIRAIAVAVSEAPTFAGVALPLVACIVLTALVLRVRPENSVR